MIWAKKSTHNTISIFIDTLFSLNKKNTSLLLSHLLHAWLHIDIDLDIRTISPFMNTIL
jgi:hypothetical protein